MKYVLILFFLVSNLSAEKIVVEGTILNSDTKEKISNVNIYIDELSLGTISDNNGYFKLILPENTSADLVFQHVAFDTIKVSITEAQKASFFYLKPSISETNRINAEATKGTSEMEKDLPQTITIINQKDFAGIGYIDAGDLLKNQQGMQVEENISGKKTVSLRGGNADDIGVFFNGVKMNSTYDGIFDFSLINLEDIEQIEIIRGSNTVLFGSDAFSGIINIVPRANKNYNARFSQKIGSYNSGEWSLNLSKSFTDKFYLNYSIYRSGSKRPYDTGDGYLENENTNHSVNFIYNLKGEEKEQENQKLSIMYLRSSADFNNTKLASGIEDLNQLASFKFVGDIGLVKNLNITSSIQDLDNKRSYVDMNKYVRQSYLNDNYFLNIQKSFLAENYSFLTAYQFEHNNLKISEDSTSNSGIEFGELKRNKNAAIGIFKFQTPSGDDLLSADINLSYRFDFVSNQQGAFNFRNTPENVSNNFKARNSWNAQTLKFASQLTGLINNLKYTFFLNVGKNVKFPSMFQQLSTPAEIDVYNPQVIANLNPEENNSTEIGIELFDEVGFLNIDGWQLNISYFNSLFENKFRTFYQFGSGFAFYDNYPNAKISGIEYSFRSFIKNRYTMELTGSHLVVSEKAAFPFKSDTKFTFKILYDYLGYSAKINWFYENEQAAWIRIFDGGFGLVELPPYTNLDFHFSKGFEYYKLKYSFFISVRNILSDDTVVEGFALRDRRYYLGVNFEY